jgi:hypothetical protein
MGRVITGIIALTTDTTTVITIPATMVRGTVIIGNSSKYFRMQSALA